MSKIVTITRATKPIKITLLILTLLTSAFATAPLFADGIDFNVGQDTARFTYSAPVGSAADYGRKDITLGVLYNKDDNTFIDAALHIIDEAGSKFPGLELGVGPKAYLGQTNTEEYLTIGFEALGNYRLVNLNRFILSGYGYYAPSILSFIDADELWELHFRASYELIPSASVYIGYRKIRAKVNVITERTIDDEFYFGIKMDF